MAIDFNADEVFEMAEQIEKNGAAFYRKAAGQCPDDQSAGLLVSLAEMEDRHLETFARMRAQLQSDQKTPTAFDPQGEAELYLKAFADGHIFDVSAEPADLLTGTESLAQILKMAIGIEKDSVVFYTGLRDLVPARLGKDGVENVIREEMKHITILSRELASAV